MVCCEHWRHSGACCELTCIKHVSRVCIVMQNVTLGGTGKEIGDRHPKVGNHVLIGCGASVLGNITIGVGAQIAAGSLVLKPVEPHTLVAGSPAKYVRDVSGNPAALLQQWLQPSDDPHTNSGNAQRPEQRVTVTGLEVPTYQKSTGERQLDAESALFGSATGHTSNEGPLAAPQHADGVEDHGAALSQQSAAGQQHDRLQVSDHPDVAESSAAASASPQTASEAVERAYQEAREARDSARSHNTNVPGSSTAEKQAVKRAVEAAADAAGMASALVAAAARQGSGAEAHASAVARKALDAVDEALQLADQVGNVATGRWALTVAGHCREAAAAAQYAIQTTAQKRRLTDVQKWSDEWEDAIWLGLGMGSRDEEDVHEKRQEQARALAAVVNGDLNEQSQNGSEPQRSAVAATTSDQEAERLWGQNPAEPEFFI